MRENILPSIVLTIICVVASLLLVFAHELTKGNIEEQRQIRFNKSVQAIFGETDSKLLDNNFGEESVQAIAVTTDGRTAIQVTADGYSKGGINILVGIDESGAISGIEFVSLGETPGLGSKVRDNADFREQFYGATETDVPLDTISGATFSSKGMKSAVDTAMRVYTENKEMILNG